MRRAPLRARLTPLGGSAPWPALTCSCKASWSLPDTHARRTASSQDFPLSLKDLLPLLDVLGTANKVVAKVG